MLLELSVKNVATIEKIEWSLKRGFTALTGETGAGKSILIDSVLMLLGEKASKEIIRNGTEKATVTGVFNEISDFAKKIMEENGIEPEEDGTVIISREITLEGRSVSRINGKIATVGAIKNIGRTLVNIHGQHENQILLNEENHLSILDSYGETSRELNEYKEKYNELISFKKEIKKLSGDEERKAAREEYLQNAIEEISAAQIKNGEEDELNSLKNEVKNSEKIEKAASEGYEILFGAEGSVCDKIFAVKREIDGISSIKKEFAEYAKRLDSLLTEAKDIAYELHQSENGGKYMSLESLENRLSEFHRLKIKYNCPTADALNALMADYEKEALELSNREEILTKLKKDYSASVKELEKRAEKLSKKRKESAQELDKKIIDELKYLDMNNVRFITEIKNIEKEGKRSFSVSGGDSVRFLISANLGEEPKPLAKISSGGEISRLMLAIKAVMAKSLPVPTLIFDEIDTGVSGKTAAKIGNKMKEISENCQVICVTHLAQIAAKATSQSKIEKKQDGIRSYSEIKILSGNERIDELARIIGGEIITDAARETARELMEI